MGGLTQRGGGPSRVSPTTEAQCWWPEPRAAGPAALVGEVDLGDDVLFGSSLGHQGCQVVEHELGAAQHGEYAVGTDVAPRQVHEPCAAAALNRRAAEVEARVPPDDVKIGAPNRGVAVSGNQVDRLTTLLDADVDVVAGAVVEVPGPAR